MTLNYFKTNDTLPVFPLPNTILFPGVSIPLHIFEPRYKTMVKDILDRKGVFCLATISENWNGEHDGDFEYYETGTVCCIEKYNDLPDGRYNIVVNGLNRARLKHSNAYQQKPYRCVEVVEIIEDWKNDLDKKKEEEIRQVAFNFFKTLPTSSSDSDIIAHFANLNSVQLANVLCMNSPCSMAEKHAIFELSSLSHVCDALLAYFDSYRIN